MIPTYYTACHHVDPRRLLTAAAMLVTMDVSKPGRVDGICDARANILVGVLQSCRSDGREKNCCDG